MTRSIKWKITFWYTIIIVIVFSVVLGGAFIYSELYGEGSIKEELLDEVKDFKEDMIAYSDDLAQADLGSYYDDSVMLSIYDKNGNIINGIFPEEFPDGVVLVGGEIRTLETDDEHWFIYDEKITTSNGTEIWIRGISSYHAMAVMLRQLTVIMLVLFPLLIVFTAFLVYKMIKRSLKPVQTVTEAASEIANSSALSRRIDLPNNKDEIYELSATFNEMLEKLEDNFVKERRFASDVAHELRTPISVILSHCEYCLDELELSDEVRTEVKLIQKKSQHMADLVTNMLAISRAETNAFKPSYEEVDLQILAESVAEELEEKAKEKNINIVVEGHMLDPMVIIDMSMMMRVFINMMENAINYGKTNGYAKVILEETERNVKIIFEDNGIGISLEEQKNIWDRFYQVDASRSGNKGFGLGLFMVKQIVEAHKGNITVESELGKGSKFIIEIPRR